MTRLHRQPICVASALMVPFLAMASPPWLAIDGVGPAWAVLWLLPWSLVDGPVSGALSGLALGLVLDGLNLAGLSQVPALLLLGWWVLLSGLIGWPRNAGLPQLASWLEQQPHQAIALVIGLEASAWLHLILDGDPWPVEWAQRRRR